MAELGRINWQRQQLAVRERQVRKFLETMSSGVKKVGPSGTNS
jgi:hypothetical protein